MHTPHRRLRFCANLKWLFTERPFPERFALAAAAGFGGVEYASPYEYPPGQLARWLNENGLQQTLINTPMGPPGSPSANGVACHPDSVATFREQLHKALEYSAALSCQQIHVVAGKVPTGCSSQRAIETLQANLQWASDLAQKQDVRLLLECINQRDARGYVLHSLEQTTALIENLANPAVGLLFDIYHCARGGLDPATQLKRCWPYIAHLQVADSPNRGEPGTGDLDWPALFRDIVAAGYDGWIGCEYRPVASTAQGLSWLTHLP
jgi:hydroxypyruvate isomerase